MRHPAPLEERLLRFVLDGSCWSWTGTTNNYGYGQMNVPGKRKLLVHRAAYEVHVGPIPDGLTIDHLCCNRRCINPEHLEVVTRRENILRGNNLAARNARKTHCIRGHPLDGVGYVQTRGSFRYCRTCRRGASK